MRFSPARRSLGFVHNCGVVFRLARRSPGFFLNCGVVFRLILHRWICDRGLFFLTSREQCGASQNVDVFLHNLIRDSQSGSETDSEQGKVSALHKQLFHLIWRTPPKHERIIMSLLHLALGETPISCRPALAILACPF